MDEPIAIIGLDARLPGEGDTAEHFYESLIADAERPGSTHARHAHFLKGSVSAFDAPFFSITPTEAKSMDPQQRGMLESVYKALENAGVPLTKAAGSQTGVYVGCFTADYNDMTIKDFDMPSKYAATGTVASMLSNRVSWFYDFRGPSLTIDTACSSSLVAAHEACMSLKLREISMAIVGGCNLILSPEMTLKLGAAGVLGPDGKSQSFDARGNGYARGEGFGVLVLKRVSDALRDGDVIRAVIRNSSTNQDGRSPGITQPTKAAQAQLIRHVYARANLDPALTRFFEAHGTGTPVGDPIEASAIADMFAPHRSAEEPLYVGALKSNVGHLEGAAGVAALIKGVLTLEHGVIPPNIWFDKVNPRIQAAWNLKFPTEPTAWPQDGVRRMSINSFGIGGSNAHVVMDDALHFLKQNRLKGNHRTEGNPKKSLSRLSGLVNGSRPPSSNGSSNGRETTDHDAVPKLLALSSHDQPGVARLRDAYAHYLEAKFDDTTSIAKEVQFMGDLSYTLSAKRTHHAWRTFVKATSPSSLSQALKTLPQATRTVSVPRLGFVFTGQGAQWPTMGLELMVYRTFRQSLFAADTYLNDLGCPWSLVYELTKTGDGCRLDNPEFCQPVCTALQVALVDLLASWNVRPHAITGHSSGEVAGAYAVGALSREAAWKVAYYRGKLSAQLCSAEDQPRTGMAAVGLDAEKTQAAIDRITGEGTLQIACYNSWNSHTVSGDIRKIEALVEMLSSENVFARKLQVDIAYHSQYMRAMADEYLEAMGQLQAGQMKDGAEAPQFFSSTLGSYIPCSRLSEPSYWVQNLVSPVRFAESATAMLTGSTGAKTIDGVSARTVTDVMEIGPHSALKGPLTNIIGALKTKAPAEYHSVLRRKASAVESALSAAGSLYCRGYDIDLQKINSEGQSGARPAQMLTDLPSYVFNHAVEYWNESRLSREFRLRKHGRHELLGAPVPGWTKNSATWRNYIRRSENPWVEDHRVSGDVLYPAAGMLVMAVEAARQVADEGRALRGLRFRDVSFHLALRIPDDAQGVEAYFSLRPHRETSAPAATAWHEFQLTTFEGDEWREHCRGLVKIEYATEGELEDQLLRARCSQAMQAAQSTCTTKFPTSKVYRGLKESGLEFGSTFQTLSNVSVGDAYNILARVDSTVPLIKEAMAHGYVQPHLVHPATLDGVVHANLAPLVLDSKHPQQPRVPIFADEIWIAAGPEACHDAYLVSAQAQLQGRNDAQSSATAVHPVTGEPLVYASGLVFKALPGSASEQSQPSGPLGQSAFNVDWKPDPGFMSADQAQKAFGLPMTADEDPSSWMEDCEDLCLAYIRHYLVTLSPETRAKLDWHHSKYVSWMQHIVGASTDRILGGEFQQLEEKVRARNAPEGKLIIAVGQALHEMLGGPRDPLDVIFGNKIAEEVYREGLGSKRCYVQLCNYIDALAHENPALKVLEIGAGTGGATRPVMATLTKNGRRYQHYEFTDISPSFFEQARNVFGGEAAHMGFRVLNVENDPEAQGFEAGSYDVVVAANVLHATKNIETSLAHARKLLRPGGKLLLFEITNLEILLSTFCFGVLPGWWLSEDTDRVWGPLMSVEGWRDHLDASGFGGLQGVFHDFPGSPHQMSSILVSSVPSPEEPQKPGPVYMVVEEASALQKQVSSGFSAALTEHATCETTTLAGIQDKDLASATCILLAELDASILQNMTQQRFAALQHILAKCDTLVWLTRGGDSTIPDPNLELVTGLARVAREERPGFNFLTVSFANSESPATMVDKSVQILHGVAMNSDNNFRVADGLVYVPRLVEDTSLTQHVQAQTGTVSVVNKQVALDAPGSLVLQAGTLGQLDSLRFEDDLAFDTPLLDDEVEFTTMACGLSGRDLASARGKTDEVPLGLEAAGIVTRVGSASKYAAGDRVFGLCPSGGAKTRVRSSDNFLAKMPDAMTWAEAASLPVAYTTAHAVLLRLGAPLAKGDTVLVHSAASALGQAMTQLALQHAATVFATVNSSAERDLLQTRFHMPREHIFSQRDASFRAEIKRITKGRGVDVALGEFTGDVLRDTCDTVAPFGRIVEITSSGSGYAVGGMKRNVSFEAFDLGYRAEYDAVRTQTWFQEAVEFLKTPEWRGRDAKLYPFSKVREAFHTLQAGEGAGQLVLVRSNDDTLPLLPSRRPASAFSPDASYVVAGGLGGLGRSVSRWMASRGARNLILLSRRGPVQDSAKEFIGELEAMSIRVAAPACDVTDRDALKEALEECQAIMPPIKGCIQGSMVLKDNRIENMSVDEWNSAVQSKVDTSRNLAQVLGRLDFFILLSSTVGITGNAEQSNYAAGNTFQDAFARHLAAQGMPAVTLDLPVIRGAGFVADKPELMDYMRATGWASMDEADLHAVLDYHCRAVVRAPQVVPRFWLPQETAAEGYQLPHWRHDALFRPLALTKSEGAAATVAETKRVNHAALLGHAATKEDAQRIVLDALMQKLARVLSVDVANLDAARPLHAYGVDSLVAVELRAWLAKELRAQVSVFDITGKPSIAHLAGAVLEKTKLTKLG